MHNGSREATYLLHGTLESSLDPVRIPHQMYQDEEFIAVLMQIDRYDRVSKRKFRSNLDYGNYYCMQVSDGRENISLLVDSYKSISCLGRLISDRKNFRYNYYDPIVTKFPIFANVNVSEKIFAVAIGSPIVGIFDIKKIFNWGDKKYSFEAIPKVLASSAEELYKKVIAENQTLAIGSIISVAAAVFGTIFFSILLAKKLDTIFVEINT